MSKKGESSGSKGWSIGKESNGSIRPKESGVIHDPDGNRGHRPNIPKIDPNSVQRPTGSALKPPPKQ